MKVGLRFVPNIIKIDPQDRGWATGFLSLRRRVKMYVSEAKWVKMWGCLISDVLL